MAQYHNARNNKSPSQSNTSAYWSPSSLLLLLYPCLLQNITSRRKQGNLTCYASIIIETEYIIKTEPPAVHLLYTECRTLTILSKFHSACLLSPHPGLVEPPSLTVSSLGLRNVQTPAYQSP
jgi:hypothetical protein